MATENLAPQVISRLMAEIRDLVRHPSEGIEYIESESDTVSEIHACITGPGEIIQINDNFHVNCYNFLISTLPDSEGTPYVGGKFRLKLVLNEDYPNSPPKGFFLTKIYHPNIANNGDICVNTLKKDWTPEVTLKHVLQVIRCLLIVPFPESSLNDEAGKLFMDSYEEFARRARIMTNVHATLESGSSTSCAAGTEGGAEDAPDAEDQKKAKAAKKKSLKRL